jgi:hypothetical protein
MEKNYGPGEAMPPPIEGPPYPPSAVNGELPPPGHSDNDFHKGSVAVGQRGQTNRKPSVSWAKRARTERKYACSPCLQDSTTPF